MQEQENIVQLQPEQSETEGSPLQSFSESQEIEIASEIIAPQEQQISGEPSEELVIPDINIELADANTLIKPRRN